MTSKTKTVGLGQAEKPLVMVSLNGIKAGALRQVTAASQVSHDRTPPRASTHLGHPRQAVSDTRVHARGKGLRQYPLGAVEQDAYRRTPG